MRLTSCNEMIMIYGAWTYIWPHVCPRAALYRLLEIRVWKQWASCNVGRIFWGFCVTNQDDSRWTIRDDLAVWASKSKAEEENEWRNKQREDEHFPISRHTLPNQWRFWQGRVKAKLDHGPPSPVKPPRTLAPPTAIAKYYFLATLRCWYMPLFLPFHNLFLVVRLTVFDRLKLLPSANWADCSCV